MSPSQRPLLSRPRQWLAESLPRRLLVGLVAALLLSATLLTGLTLWLGQRAMRQEQAHALTQLVTVLESSLQNAMLQRDLPGLQRILDTLGQAPGIEQVRLLNREGEVRFASDPGQIGKILPTPCPQGRCSTMGLHSLPQERQGLDAQRIVYPIANQTRCLQCHGDLSQHPINGVLLIDLQTRPQAWMQWSYQALLLTAIGALVLLSLLMAWVLKHQLTRPLQRLSQATQRMGEGDYSARVQAPGSPQGLDEIARIGQQFDLMATQVAQTVLSLREHQAFLQQLVDAVPDAILVIDADHRIRIANRAYAEMLGRTPQEVAGERCHRIGRALSEPCPATMVNCPLLEVRERKSHCTIMSLRHRDGHEIPVEIDSAILQMAQERLVVQVLRPLDKAIRYSQELRLSTIGLLANGVAHEIHNPLASIRLALQAGLRGLRREDISRTELMGYLELVDDQIDRCVLTTRRLMNMSQPPSAELVPVALVPAIADVITLIAEEARLHKVHMHHDLQPDDVWLLADDAELRQIFINLIHNAIHAMPDGGELHILGRMADDGRYRIEVRDTGVGIPADNLSRIFQPFFSRRADGQAGMGLGLAVTKSIITRFGGDIQVSSTVGEGTVFTLVLRCPEPLGNPDDSTTATLGTQP